MPYRLAPLAALLLSAALEPQRQLTPPDPQSAVPMRPGFEYLRPFRAPNKDVQPPLEFFDELRTLHAMARNPAGARVHFDEEGREVVDHPVWKEARTRALIKGMRQGGYLAVVAQESGSAGDRRLAFYGSYFIESVQDTIAIMSLLPGEPVAAIREENLPRALAFLRVHLARNRGGDVQVRPATPIDHAEGRSVGDKVYEQPDAPLYDFDLRPWCALVESGELRDQAQALWFLTEVIGIRREFGRATLELMRPFLPRLLAVEHPELRTQLRAYLHAVDPQQPQPKADAGPAELQAWLDAIAYAAFPPIRRVSPGLVELHPSPDLDAIAATGEDLLARDAIGSVASGTARGTFYRGFRVQRLPPPLDKLGIPLDAVITHVNGLPITDSKSLLEAVKQFASKRRAMMVEFVADRQTRAIEYRLR